MPRIRAFISGALGGLYEDGLAVRTAINSLGLPDYSGFLYEAIPPKPVIPGYRKQIFKVSNVFVLLVSEDIPEPCSKEYNYARYLGMPCFIFVRKSDKRTRRLLQFLRKCPDEIIEYSGSQDILSDLVKKHIRFLMDPQHEQQLVIVHTKQILKSIITELAKNPDRIYKLVRSWRKFEELIAGIIASFNYDVQITQLSRDGGYDIIARRKELPFPTMHLIEAKFWTPPKKIGRPVIQAIYGTGKLCKADGVMVITPTAFADRAIKEAGKAEPPQYVRIVDGKELPEFYKRYLALNP